MLIDLLRKLAVCLEKKQNNVFKIDMDKQERYISSFKEPEDDIERSFFQYKCQMKLYGMGVAFVLNLFSLPVLMFELIAFSRKEMKKQKDVDAVFFRDGKPENIMPQQVRNQYENLECNPKEGNCLSKTDFKFIGQILKRYPISWLFVLKSVIKISRYRATIEAYKPAAIIACNEYSFASSLMTAFCRENDVLHINVMHGEKFFHMRDSFFRFDQCYVWDEHYKHLFLKLRAEASQFEIALPESLVFAQCGVEKLVDYTYYLGMEDEIMLNKIAEALKIIAQSKKVAIRPHPRYSDNAKIKQKFGFVEIEEYCDISIEESILRTKNVISRYSTVLTQALYNGVNVIIDDYTEPRQYEKLKKLEYVAINKPHLRLTEVLAKCEKEIDIEKGSIKNY